MPELWSLRALASELCKVMARVGSPSRIVDSPGDLRRFFEMYVNLVGSAPLTYTRSDYAFRHLDSLQICARRCRAPEKEYIAWTWNGISQERRRCFVYHAEMPGSSSRAPWLQSLGNSCSL